LLQLSFGEQHFPLVKFPESCWANASADMTTSKSKDAIASDLAILTMHFTWQLERIYHFCPAAESPFFSIIGPAQLLP